MKKIYQSPQVLIVQMQAADRFLITQSDTTVSGENGGWVKEDPITPSNPHYNVWDDDWRPDEERNNQGWK